ncbi:MAG: amidohydrolase family protein [Parvularculaceae bacterium]
MRAIVFLTVFVAFVAGLPASAETIALTHVTIVDVEDGTQRTDQTLLIRNGRIVKADSAGAVKTPADARMVDGSGKYVIPGLWDMHVHSHRAGRWKYHYPLFRAYGVTGVRDAGSHLGSALVAMERVKKDPLAPRVVWGSPIIDGAPQFNSFGLSAEDEASGRVLVRVLTGFGFDFIKVYDRLTPEAYFGIADEARKLGVPLEGHVPLSLAPNDVINAGQRLIDHLTLVVEACTPGALDVTHAEFAKAPAESDSLAILTDERIAAALPDYDAEGCKAMFGAFAGYGVWQVPTLVEMRGYFYADDPAVTNDPRISMIAPSVLAEWREWGETSDPRELANGKKMFAAQKAAMRAMQDAGVGILTGTDASNEPWVFAGGAVHDEMQIMVEAGLTPLEALQAATINPLRYLGRKRDAPVISKGEPADLVLLDADPLADISNTLRIRGVFTRGDYYGRDALDALIGDAKRAAAQDGR